MTESLVQTIRRLLDNFQTGYWEQEYIPGDSMSVSRDLGVACEAAGGRTDAELEAALYRDVKTGEELEDCADPETLEELRKKYLQAEQAEPYSEEAVKDAAGNLMEEVLSNFNQTGMLW